MSNIDLLALCLFTVFRVEELNLSWLYTMAWSMPAHIQNYLTCQLLDTVASEDRYKLRSIFKEIVNLLARNPPVVTCESSTHLFELLLSNCNKAYSWWSFNELFHRLQMLCCNKEQLFILHNHLDLILEGHHHEVKQGLHGILVQLTIWTLSDFLKYLFHALDWIHLLWAEDLIYDSLRQHVLNDTFQHFWTFLLCLVLISQPLIEDVDHFSAQIKDYER